MSQSWLRHIGGEILMGHWTESLSPTNRQGAGPQAWGAQGSGNLVGRPRSLQRPHAFPRPSPK